MNLKFPILLIVILLLTFRFESVSAGWFGHKSKIDSIQIFYDTLQLRLPGESFKIGATAYLKNGKIKQTNSLYGGNWSWSHCKIEVTGGEFRSGLVKINSRLCPSYGKYILVKVYPNEEPQLAKELLLPLHYDTRIKLIGDAQMVKAPGFSFPFMLRTTFNNGQQRDYSRKSKYNMFEDYDFFVNGGFLKGSRFAIESDFENLPDHEIRLEVISRRNPECSDLLTVALDYKAPYLLTWSGSDGFSGWSGSNGSDGSSGDDGGHGGDGSDGEYGDDGPDIGVWTDLYFDSLLVRPMLYVYAENFRTGRSRKYLINPDGGSLKVVSMGGDGGSGGSGGRGGNGGRGADGETHSQTEVKDSVNVTVTWQDPGKNGGDGGCGGNGGDGGDGGNGGNVFLYFTADAQPFSHLVTGHSISGSGGISGSSGWGGSGGSGGSGSPSGSSGSSGRSGSSGSSGWWGSRGQIFYDETEEFFEYKPLTEK